MFDKNQEMNKFKKNISLSKEIEKHGNTIKNLKYEAQHENLCNKKDIAHVLKNFKGNRNVLERDALNRLNFTERSKNLYILYEKLCNLYDIEINSDISELILKLNIQENTSGKQNLLQKNTIETNHKRKGMNIENIISKDNIKSNESTSRYYKNLNPTINFDSFSHNDKIIYLSQLSYKERCNVINKLPKDTKNILLLSLYRKEKKLLYKSHYDLHLYDFFINHRYLNLNTTIKKDKFTTANVFLDNDDIDLIRIHKKSNENNFETKNQKKINYLKNNNKYINNEFKIGYSSSYTNHISNSSDCLLDKEGEINGRRKYINNECVLSLFKKKSEIKDKSSSLTVWKNVSHNKKSNKFIGKKWPLCDKNENKLNNLSKPLKNKYGNDKLILIDLQLTKGNISEIKYTESGKTYPRKKKGEKITQLMKVFEYK
ncbi:hypothetical protein TCON_1256 [Astathelohania contejeani]|uniref:Uncharacterized protein n=1 Tax=Astathelohania contejeani TaxID=164912 RepID=A0ABQ7HZE4_9MICR|nr:hypothetical protein TCON_1256 [Thelohania contejeani]